MSNNIFEELGFSSGESANLKVRSQLMMALQSYIDSSELDQKQLAALFNVSQPRVSNLKNGHIDLFSIDTLINMAAAAGLTVSVQVHPPSIPALAEFSRGRSAEMVEIANIVGRYYRPNTDPRTINLQPSPAMAVIPGLLNGKESSFSRSS